MKLKRIVGASLFAGGMVVSTGASALNVDGITFENGAVLEATQIFETQVTAVGQTLDGIGIVTIIRDGNGNATWNNGDNGRELTFQFNNYLVEAIDFLNPGVALVSFSGGDAQFYSDTNQDFSVNSGAGKAGDIANATNGNLWLTLTGVGGGTVCGGAGPLDPAVCGSGAGTIITLQSTVFFSGDLGTTNAGFGGGFLDVANAGGAADSYFDTDSQPSGQDVDLFSNFSRSQVSPNWTLDGTADLNLLAVPEPATLGLLGVGLLGLGLVARRRKKAI